MIKLTGEVEVVWLGTDLLRRCSFVRDSNLGFTTIQLDELRFWQVRETPERIRDWLTTGQGK